MTASTDLHASQAPPETLPELRSLALAIAQGKSIVTLGSKAAEALSRILEMGGDPVMLSITFLAENLSVNPSPLTRLATRLGIPGFLPSDRFFFPGRSQDRVPSIRNMQRLRLKRAVRPTPVPQV